MIRIILGGAVLALCAAAPAHAGTLTIEVQNIRAAKGVVRIDVCREREFLGDACGWHARAATQAGTTLVTVTGLPAGRYAVQAYLDENDNDKVDRAIFGIPREGIGFSNNARIGLGPPKFADAVFGFNGAEAKIALRLRYFLGKKGPLDGQP